MNTYYLDSLFYIDILSKIMLCLVLFIGTTVYMFAGRYMDGDSNLRPFKLQFAALLISIVTMVTADNLLLFLAAWGVSNFFLIRLMIHKPQWRAARFSGLLAAKSFLISSFCLMLGFLMLYLGTGHTSIQSFIQSPPVDHHLVDAALILILISAMAQSAIWPFHRWLLSSLNSPTPVSAIMHAGLINGGGFLMIRFAPVYLRENELLTILFVAGVISAILGTLWKLLQNDYKRMLASSTMGQMGFMMVQCGLGLFSAAVAHLCWHGMFKAYLFLFSGNAAKEKRLSRAVQNNNVLLLSLIVGILGGYIFLQTSGISLKYDTTLIILAISTITSTQFSIAILHENTRRNLFLAFIFTSIGAALYGLSVKTMHILLSPLNIDLAQPLNIYHIIAMILLFGAWLVLNLGISWPRYIGNWKIIKYLYVKCLNASQPHPLTITTHHNHYHY